MAKSKGPKVYAVARGRVPGIYGSWSECQAQTSGFGGAIFKSFKTRGEAQAFVQANSASGSSSASAPAPAAAASAASITSSSGSSQSRKRAPDGASAPDQRKRASKCHLKSQPSLVSDHPLQITIHFDGGSRGNPGLAGAGAEVVVVDNTAVGASTTATFLVREFCGLRATNNFAEYRGLVAGLEQAKKCIEQYTASKCPERSSMMSTQPATGSFRLQVFGDSNLIVQQLRGAWQCKNANIVPLFQQSQRLVGEIQKMDSQSEISFEHVYREHNKAADALANEAMDRRKSWTTTAENSANDGSSDKARDNNRKPATAVPVSAPTANKNTSQVAVSSREHEVIDVNDSDNDSHYSV